MIKKYDQFSEKYAFFSLFPYSENSQLLNKQQKLDDLYLSKNILYFAIESLQTFLTGELTAFDAQVGENLCQIRAYKILYLAKKWLSSSTAKHELRKNIEKLESRYAQLKTTIFEWEYAVKNAKSFNEMLDNPENVTDFFENNKLGFTLHEDIVFIIVCRFLTHFNLRRKNIPIAIDLNLIASEFHISKYRSKRLMHRYQQLVCQLGCRFILNIAQELRPEPDYMELLSSLCRISDENRTVLPCYTVSKIIFNHMIINKIPMLFIVNRFEALSVQPYDVIHFLLQGNDNQEFSLLPCSAYSERNCIVVSGEVYDGFFDKIESAENYILRVLNENPFKLILANTAIHPQYSGKKLISYKENPYCSNFSDKRQSHINKKEADELKAMQYFALNSGCSKQYPYTFFLKHIYANIVNHETNKMVLGYTGCAFSAINQQVLRNSRPSFKLKARVGCCSRIYL